jgi:uncharacterized repeat protein (TIGR03803 family)
MSRAQALPGPSSKHGFALLFTILATLIFPLALVPRCAAQSLYVLHSFTGYPSDGSGAVAAPIKDKNGNLFGVTFAGGTKDWGTVYEISAAGTETVLHSFTGGSDGITPLPRLYMDDFGNLYGTTNTGGSTQCFDGNGCGIVFELSPTKTGWKETVLYAFQGGADGGMPGYGALVRDAAGNLYGTTMSGGAKPWPNGHGAVYKLTRTSTGWTESVLYAFGANSSNDGSTPYGGVIVDSVGNVYGTTYYGGSANLGTVFTISPSGQETFLYSFPGGSAGMDPFNGVVRDKNGNLYGTANSGGDPTCNCGVVFKIDTSGAASILHTFTGYPSDGGNPELLTLAPSGILYGTTYYGGNSKSCVDDGVPIGCGIVYKLDTSANQTILFDFNVVRQGSEVDAGVTLDSNGNLYGATSSGGTGGGGTVYEVTK